MGQLTERQLKELAKSPPDKVTRVWDGGGGLYAQVSPNGVISFWMKYRFRRPGEDKSVERADGIGRWGPDSTKGQLSLADARDAIRERLVALRQGRDPRHADAPPAVTDVPTFRVAAQRWLEHIEREGAALTGPKRYVATCNSEFGDKRLDAVTVDDVSRALYGYRKANKLESEKRCRIACSQVFEYAIAAELTQKRNPVSALREITRKSPKPRKAVKHHAAMEAKAIPDFLRKLGANPNIAPSIRLGLRFTALTVLRTGEVMDLRWTDLAKDGKSLTIPAERMKGGKAHTVFLSKQARAVLDEMRPFGEGRDYVFPGRDPNEPMSRMSMLMTLRRMDTGATVHGFRSSFSTWAHATRAADDHVIERCLAHAAGDQVAVAYNRHKYDAEAARLWQRWADVIAPK